MPEDATVTCPDEDRPGRRFERIIGNSAALESVLEQVEQVASTDSTVLIEGETGTGKELVAHAIHNASRRVGRAFIKLNCAAIPLDLLESELFGHEKGAFTGAIAQKIGRFEMADKGTLFLDEVGDIPPALQPKLLRVLQEQEFERLGSGHTHKVDVRLVAATNRNLVKMVAGGQFRTDLYYRLNVFPVLLPALRERREDIPELVTHFVALFSCRMGKRVDNIPPETMAAFQWYSWPGNIRELQNLVERAVILSQNGVLPNPLHKKQAELVSPSLHHIRTYYSSATLEDSDRALILETLEQARWVVGGPRGAATTLGLKRTTLLAKMKRLGISRPNSQEETEVFSVATRDESQIAAYTTSKDAIPEQAIRDQLCRVMESPLFIQSDRLGRFLRFTVETTLAGEAGSVKEYLIGTEVYERKPPYHPGEDSIVRSEARRLRRKLKEYYESDGKDDPVLIYYRPGSYVPIFSFRELFSERQGIRVAVLPFVDASGRQLVGQVCAICHR